jgi:hypothetical protein
MKFNKGLVSTAVGIGIILIIGYIFYGIVLPTVINQQIDSQSTIYTNATVNLTNNNNATFIANGSGTYKTLQLNGAVQPYSETATNTTTDLNGTCNLTRGTNYTINYGSGLVNLTNVWTSAPCGLATLPISGVYSFNYSGSYVNPQNWTSYAAAGGLVSLTPLFNAVLIIILVCGSAIMLVKAAGLM